MIDRNEALIPTIANDEILPPKRSSTATINLTEEDLDGGVEVFWKNKKHITGNRRHDLVDLYKDGEFVRTVLIKEINDV